MAQYFGKGRFQRESYDAIVGQLKTVLKENPALAQRLWETTNLGESFMVRGVIQAQFEAIQKTSKAPRKARVQEQANFYKSLKDSESVKELSAYFTLEELKQPPFSLAKEKLEAKELAKSLLALAEGKQLGKSQTPKNLKPFLRAMTPDLDQLVGPDKAFELKESTKSATPLRAWIDKSVRE